jgi:metallophosphoesterase superfamily enzyme
MGEQMWSSEEVFVLSDLHLAAENGEGLFQADADLASCLNWIRSETSGSTVVLAGDVLDYLVIAEGDT